MTRLLLIAVYAFAFLALITAYPLPHHDKRELSLSEDTLSARSFVDPESFEDLERRASRKSRATARKAKGITKNPKTGKKPGAPLPKGVKGAAAKKHVHDAKAAKNMVKNNARNAALKKAGKPPVSYGASKKGLKVANTKNLKHQQRLDDKAMHTIKTAGRPPRPAHEIAAEKSQHKAHLAVARAEHKKSLATGTFPSRNAKFTTAKGNTYTGKDVRQAGFTAHLAAQKPVGFKLSDGSTLRTKDRHPKTFENRPQGPAGAKTRPLPDISGTGAKYREFGIVNNKMKGYDGRSPNPTEARLITKPNAAGVHEFAAVVAHPNSSGPDKNDHHVVRPT